MRPDTGTLVEMPNVGITYSELIQVKPRLLITTSVMLLFTTAWTAMRIASRQMGGLKYRTEDWFHLAAQICFYGLAICVYIMVEVADFGTVITDLNGKGKILYRTLLPFRILYALTLLCVKLSILVLIRRTFARGHRLINTCCWIAITLSVMWAMYASIIEFVFCIPIQNAWDPTVRATSCLNWALSYGAIPFFDIFIELFILAIPIKSILGLNLRKPHKIGLLTMFILGIITTVFSGIVLYANLRRQLLAHTIVVVHCAVSLMIASSTVCQPLFDRTIVPWFHLGSLNMASSSVLPKAAFPKKKGVNKKQESNAARRKRIEMLRDMVDMAESQEHLVLDDLNFPKELFMVGSSPGGRKST